MARCSAKHKQLDKNGLGICSVPIWVYPGVPAGFCDELAYGEQTEPGRRRYEHYVPGLACYGHGGPKENLKTIEAERAARRLVHATGDCRGDRPVRSRSLRQRSATVQNGGRDVD